MKLISLLLLLSSVTAWASSTRTIDADALQSSSHATTLTLPAATDTLVGKATTDTLTNKTISFTGNTFTGALAQSSLATPSVKTKTTTYTILAADQFIAFDSSGGAYDTTLPAANAAQNLAKTFVKTTSDFNEVRILPAGSDTIVYTGTTLSQIALDTVDEEWIIVPDGVSKWYVSAHKASTPAVSYTPNVAGYSGFAAPSVVSFFWEREHDHIIIYGNLTTGSTNGTEIQIPIPTGLTTAGSSKIGTLSLAGHASGASNLAGHWTTLMEQSKTYFTVGISAGTQPGYSKAVGNVALNSGTAYAFRAEIPIAGWYP